jgi:hypothetical protein
MMMMMMMMMMCERRQLSICANVQPRSLTGKVLFFAFIKNELK